MGDKGARQLLHMRATLRSAYLFCARCGQGVGDTGAMTNVAKMVAATVGGIVGSAGGALALAALAPTQPTIWIAGGWIAGLVGILSGHFALAFVARLRDQRHLAPARDKAADHRFETRQPETENPATPLPIDPLRAASPLPIDPLRAATPLPIESVSAGAPPSAERIPTPSSTKSKPATPKRGKRARSSSQPAEPATLKRGKRARSTPSAEPAAAAPAKPGALRRAEADAAPPANPGGPGTAAPRAPDPVAVFKIDGVVEGWMPHEQRRLSDMLNGGDSVRVRLPERDGNRDEWLVVNPETVVAVAPPPPRSPSRLRLPRRQYPYVLRAAPYRIAGTAHIPSGSDPVHFLLTTPRDWLPLTNCTVEGGNDAWEVEVVIVNLQQVRRSGLSFGLASAEAHDALA
jgi:hypothetical protein